MAKKEPTGEMLAKIKSIAQSARARARKRDLAVDSDLVSLAIELYSAQHGRCALTGLPFILRVVGAGAARRPFAPSLDRISSDEGYTKDNVRLVCQVVNFALNAYGEDIFFDIARAAAAQAGRVPEAIECDDEPDQRQLKRSYIDFIIKNAPDLLQDHGGSMSKARLRRALRERYHDALPDDEANAYGWAFRRLTEAGVIYPASSNPIYELRSSAE